MAKKKSSGSFVPDSNVIPSYYAEIGDMIALDNGMKSRIAHINGKYYVCEDFQVRRFNTSIIGVVKQDQPEQADGDADAGNE